MNVKSEEERKRGREEERKRGREEERKRGRVVTLKVGVRAQLPTNENRKARRIGRSRRIGRLVGTESLYHKSPVKERRLPKILSRTHRGEPHAIPREKIAYCDAGKRFVVLFLLFFFLCFLLFLICFCKIV
jgi:hypothetical protein